MFAQGEAQSSKEIPMPKLQKPVLLMTIVVEVDRWSFRLELGASFEL
jgi:hypothetical protein